jgi:hypothetical protein
MSMRMAFCLVIATLLVGGSPLPVGAEPVSPSTVDWSAAITTAVAAAGPMGQVRSRQGGAARRKKVWIATAAGAGFGLFVGYQVGERIGSKPGAMIASGALFGGIGWAVGNAMP